MTTQEYMAAKMKAAGWTGFITEDGKYKTEFFAREMYGCNRYRDLAIQRRIDKQLFR